MADALLGAVIQNLQTFVSEQLATFWGVDSHVQKLSRNLTAIHAVLQDAQEKQVTSHAVKDWLQKLSDATYVLDDILDECSIKSTIQPQESMCLTRFHPKNILLRYDIAKRMKEITNRFHDIDEERRMFELRAGFIGSQSKDDDEWRRTSSAITESQIYGRDHDKEMIVEFLLRHANDSYGLSIYPIVGIGGLGKTTLAQMVFNDDEVNRHFDLKIWVCVSSDFSIERILQSIIESSTIQNPNLSTLESMQKKVQEVLLNKRYLLVLDDMWNEDQVQWDKLKCLLQCGNGIKGSSVLVTTRLENVASIMGTHPAHHLLGLSDDDNWLLFKHHAFGPNGVEHHAGLVEIGKEIVRKCAGSPLASKALGSLLRFKSEEKQWISVKESKLWDIAGENSIMRALRISYFNLELSLRRCFCFCAIFPEDFQIVKEELIHLWMANGLIESRGSLEVEDVGNEVWNELYRRSFFQEVKTDVLSNKVTFKMHDLFRDLALSIMGKECVVVSKSGNLTNLSARVRYIGCSAHYQPLNLNMGAFKKVESLRCLLEFDPPYTHIRGLPSIRSLRVLRSSSSQLSTLKNLTHLRYLNLCDSYITTLPKSISRLKKLQVLKLEYCEYLTCLPKQLTRLQDLRHLVIENCWSLTAMPPNIGKLKSLKTLSIFIVDSKAGFGLGELYDLQLGGKLHIKGLENVPNENDAKGANLINKKALNQLYLSWGSTSSARSQCGGDAEERVLEALQPHSNLKSLGIRGYKGIKLASWMRNTSILEGLVHVILWDCKNCDKLPPLGKLPHLTRLCVCGMEAMKYLDDESYDGVEDKAYKSLKKLTLLRLPNLEKVLRDEEGVEMLSLLSELCISGLPKFELPYLPSLEHLQIQGDGLKEEEASFPKGFGRNMPHLKILCISDFLKLKVLPDELGSLSALQELRIEFCDELESFSEHVLQGLSSLQALEIWYCRKLKSLSDGVGQLTCLDRLEIWNCPEMVSLPSTMNQLTSLRDMTILCGYYHGHNRILPAGLQHIPSLRSLTLIGPDSLPDWLGNMTSLQELHIVACPELRSLPSSFSHLTNLHKLTIHSCPKLQNRCRKGAGEDWQTIAHIPEFELVPVREKTFFEQVRFKWNLRKINRDPPHSYGTPDIEFDKMVDEL